MHHRRSAAMLAAGLGIIVAATFAIARNDRTPPPQEAAPAADDLGRFLVESLRGSPGCLEVKTCTWNDRRLTIVAWFEDKPAALRWYYHPVHKRLMAGADMTDRPPMQAVPDDVGPIMVMATITPGDHDNRLPGFPMPISQISIELYKPLDAGASVNGRITPQKIDLPHHRAIDGLGGQP
ncbi:MAG: hypothetical protein KF866_10310 [Phycisphaeraceae bacterium]|nr:hypothetical protein [Phycisphaeraceae bacterium]MCW5754894.1 hypothetical protein [Phycisphaeraceae bacterium]